MLLLGRVAIRLSVAEGDVQACSYRALMKSFLPLASSEFSRDINSREGLLSENSRGNSLGKLIRRVNGEPNDILGGEEGG